MPEAVVRPVSAEEIAAVMKLLTGEDPVTPGGRERTLRRGGSHPRRDRPPHGPDEPHPGDRPDNMMITVEPGVVTNEINQVLKETGLFYAGYP